LYLSELWRALWFTDLQFDLEMSRRRSVVELAPRDYDHIERDGYCAILVNGRYQEGQILEVDLDNETCAIQTPEEPAHVIYHDVPFKYIKPVDDESKERLRKENWRVIIAFTEKDFRTAEQISLRRHYDQEREISQEYSEQVEGEKDGLKRRITRLTDSNREMRQKLNEARARIVQLEHPSDQDIGSELEQNGSEEDGSEHDDLEHEDSGSTENSHASSHTAVRAQARR